MFICRTIYACQFICEKDIKVTVGTLYAYIYINEAAQRDIGLYT